VLSAVPSISSNPFQTLLSQLQGAEETDIVYVPWRMPLHNHVTKWTPMDRSRNAHMIQEAVRLSSVHMFDREQVPDSWVWESVKTSDGLCSCPLKAGVVSREWFEKYWAKWVLCSKSKKPTTDRDEHTVVQIFTLPDGRYHLHVHSVTSRKHDEDGVHVKYLIDGLVQAGYMPDDTDKYMAFCPTQSQAKLLPPSKRTQDKKLE
jgi:hypothetical protein